MKKVAFFIGEITKEYQRNLLKAMIRKAKTMDVKLFIFANYGTFGTEAFNPEGEKSIIQLPNYEDFDGIMMLSDSYQVYGMRESYVETIRKKATCPVVCLRCKEEGFYSVLYDDALATSRMVAHFVEVHHFERIAYMTGTITSQDAKTRMRGFLKSMNKYGLDTSEHRIFYGNYWKNRGEDAVNWFLDESVEPPQAIICANDYMAISVCDALKKRGIRIPEDICVAGFDNLEEAKYNFPGLTSMAVESEEAAIGALEMLEKIWNGENPDQTAWIAVKPVLRESCGCGCAVTLDAIREVYAQKEMYRHALDLTNYMFSDFENAHSFTETLATAQSSFKISDFKNIYVCLCDENQKKLEQVEMLQKFTDDMILKAVFTQEGVEFKDERFHKAELLPKEYLDGNESVIISVLHEKDECLGYVVVHTDEIDGLECLYRNWLVAFSNAISRMKMYEDNQMLEEIRELYVKDALTGIANRRGFEKKLQTRYENVRATGKGFCFFSLDMDGLKFINDHFGHSVGDEALKAFAKVLSKTVRGKGDCARVGGDEFSVCIPTQEREEAEAFCESIRANVAYYNETHDKPYTLSVSVGYAFCNRRTHLKSCMDLADQNMYIDKEKRKMARNN